MKWKIPAINIAPSETEEALFELIAHEISSGEVKPGLWTKALADSDWDEAQAKSRYVKMRHAQMMSELNRALKDSPESTENLQINPVDAAKEKAKKFGLSEEQVRYLGVPILAVDYLKKYNISKDKLAKACAVKKLTSVMHNGNLWVSDRRLPWF